MATLRFTVVVLTCLAFALPLNAFSPCCCTPGHTSPNCACSTTQTGSCCCNTAQTKLDSCCSNDESDRCEFSCKCSVLTDSDGVNATVSKHRIDLPSFAYPFELSYAIPVYSIVLRSSVDRPPIGHNRRQAALCVWRK